VRKLKAARDRKRAEGGKAGGRKRSIDVNPQLVQEAKRPRNEAVRPALSLREIAIELDQLGYHDERGAVFSPTSIASMRATGAPGRARQTV
jgi:hypothetical protein